LLKEEKKSRKEQIISLRKRYYIIHNILYFEFLLVAINVVFYTMFIYVVIMNSHSIEIEKVISIPEWEYIIYQTTQTIVVFNFLYDLILAILLFTLPIILIFMSRNYHNSLKLLPKIYRNYLPNKILKTELFPTNIGMMNGALIFLVMFFYFHNPIIQYLTIPVIIGLMIPITYLTSYLTRGGKSKAFRRKFLAGTIIFIGLMILTYISLV